MTMSTFYVTPGRKDPCAARKRIVTNTMEVGATKPEGTFSCILTFFRAFPMELLTFWYTERNQHTTNDHVSSSGNETPVV